ncbi:MAG: hypothetical protein RLZZ248_658 [Bacteroidota bacterium]|jgi:outer membrane protein
MQLVLRFNNKAMKKITILSFVALILALNVQAQKYGYLNLGNIIAAMPETAEADKALEAYQGELIAKGEQMASDFQKEYTAFANEMQQGTMAPAEQQRRSQALEQKRNEILAYEQQMQQDFQVKRQELLAPIVEKVQNIVQQIGKENQYSMIFDTGSFNSLLFVETTDDVAPLVLAKLGL